MIHIRIESDVKVKSENIFIRLGVNTWYAVSMFLNQVILRAVFPFKVELPKNSNKEYIGIVIVRHFLKSIGLLERGSIF